MTSLDLTQFRVAEMDRSPSTRYDLTPAERLVVMRENERRGVLHLVAERSEAELLNGNHGRARMTDGRSQLVMTGKGA